MQKFSRFVLYLLILQWFLSSQFDANLQSHSHPRPSTVPTVVEPPPQESLEPPAENPAGNPITPDDGGNS